MTARDEWMVPGLYEVAPGVFRIPLPLPNDGLAAVNAYALVEGEHLVLIDPGWGLTAARDVLEAALKGLGAGFGDVEHFLVTHQHRDHYTQAVLLRREFGIRISLGAEEQHSLKVVIERDETFFPQRGQLLAAGAAEFIERLIAAADGRRPPADDYELPDRWLADSAEYRLGDRVLQAIATPGHTRGHLVFRDEANGLLFAGDHVLPHITPSIGFEAAPVKLALGAFLESLKLVRRLPDTRLLPAHGPVTESAHERIDELLEHHRTRLDLIFDTVARGATTGYESARAMTWTRRGRSFDDLNVFNQMLAILETASHLELLAVQGRLVVRQEAGVDRYEKP